MLSCRPTWKRDGSMKIVAIVVLACYIFGYLSLCAYGIARTGTASGLSDIGAYALAASVGALAVLAKRL
jgi:hypothetical protein